MEVLPDQELPAAAAAAVPGVPVVVVVPRELLSYSREHWVFRPFLLSVQAAVVVAPRAVEALAGLTRPVLAAPVLAALVDLLGILGPRVARAIPGLRRAVVVVAVHRTELPEGMEPMGEPRRCTSTRRPSTRQLLRMDLLRHSRPLALFRELVLSRVFEGLPERLSVNPANQAPALTSSNPGYAV